MKGAIMTFSFILLIISLVHFFPSCKAKVYTKCGLRDELLRLGISRSFIGNWICLIESESAKDTSKETRRANGGKGLGLFQINSKNWCTYGRDGGKCNIKCENLLNDDVSDDSRCALKIYNEEGFKAWNGWVRSCKGRNIAAMAIPNNC